MKVVDIFKHRSEAVSKYQEELLRKVSPSVLEYWHEIRSKANNRALFTRLRDLSEPAVNEPSIEPVEKPAAPTFEIKPEAQALYTELQTKLGEVIHTGDWITVDQERINNFGAVTEDQQWIHTDPERAADESPFKTTIAHGFLTLALLPRLTDSVDPGNNLFPTAKMVVNIGLNSVRFPYPVKSGNRVRAESTLTKVTPIKKGLEIEREIKVQIEGVRRPGAVVTSVIQLHF
ncbi:MaoC family dehydratase [Vibrio sp. WXL210]|uniref:MaoC family dehydratase n=1 Tax=Vibrio sp. WXL210 TaxID=3450709 RepID=UPI003EC886D1